MPQPVDYDALAAQNGGSAGIDYDALAAQHGGTPGASPQRPPLSVGGVASSMWQDLKNLPAGVMAFVRHPINSTEAAVGKMDLEHPENSSGLLGAPDVLYREWQQDPNKAVGHLLEFGIPIALDAAAPVARAVAETEPVQAAATVVKGAAKGGAKALPGATHEGFYGGVAAQYLGLPKEVGAAITGGPRLARGIINGVKGALAARRAAASAGTAAPVVDDTALLDGLAAGLARGKKFSQLSPEDQASVRGIAARIKSGEAPTVPGSTAGAATSTSTTAPGSAAPRVQPRALLPAAPSVTAMPPAEFSPEADSSFVRTVPAGRGVVRGPNGRMMRQYSSTDQPLSPAAPAAPAPEPEATPETEDTSQAPAPTNNGPIRPRPGYSMGEMAQPRTDYNPAALTDEEIAALNKPKPNGKPAQPEIPQTWQRQPANGNGRLSRTAAQDAMDYQVRARNRKVNGLAQFLFDGNGEIQPGQGLTVEEAQLLSPDQWNFLARRAGLNKPSAMTIRQTLERLHQLYYQFSQQQPK